jgi:hypothetical protein
VKKETLELVAAVVAFLFFFGPSIARFLLRPEKGSLTDLRIAAWEAWAADLDKRSKIKEKTRAKLEEIARERLLGEAKAKDELVAIADEAEKDKGTPE